MRRLIDARGELDAAGERLASLLIETPSFKPNPFVKRMVLQRVMRAPGAKVAFALPVFVAPAAWAALGGAGLTVAAYSWTAQRTPAAERPLATLAAAYSPREQSPAPAAESASAAEPASPAATPSSSEPRKSHAPLKAERRLAREAKSKPAEVEDPTQVLEAVRALRKQGDAARAQTLLDRYLTSNPSGALSEDALALAIEAAAARRDPRAADYARRYLARFPNGRFRSVALRAAGR
jgi:hypothetical protein